MLNAVECFFTSKRDAAHQKRGGVAVKEGGEYADIFRTENLCINPAKTKKEENVKNNTERTNVNTTMASFFAPMPIISAITTADENNNNTSSSTAQQVTDLSGKPSDVRYIARYGRIYKRKAPSRVGYAHITCPPGHRYCKECQKPMPLDKFYTNVKRYICKRHHYLRVNKRFRERVLTSDYEKMAENAWLDLFRFCPLIGYAKAEYDRHDIKDLVINTKIPLSIVPRAVPIDPSIPMRPRNVAIISSANMALLIKLSTITCSRAQYILLVQSCNLLPTNADAGIPWAPFQNPNYERQDINVIPILEKENQKPKELPHVDGVREMMKEEEDKINESKNRLGREDQ
jgi:hypothetical protein